MADSQYGNSDSLIVVMSSSDSEVEETDTESDSEIQTYMVEASRDHLSAEITDSNNEEEYEEGTVILNTSIQIPPSNVDPNNISSSTDENDNFDSDEDGSSSHTTMSNSNALNQSEQLQQPHTSSQRQSQAHTSRQQPQSVGQLAQPARQQHQQHFRTSQEQPQTSNQQSNQPQAAARRPQRGSEDQIRTLSSLHQMMSAVYVPVLQEVHTLVQNLAPRGQVLEAVIRPRFQLSATVSNNRSVINISNSSDEEEERRRAWHRSGAEQKRKRVSERRSQQSPNESASKRTRAGASSQRAAGYDDDSGKVASCSVCLEEIDDGGDHRLVALKCGHPFGENCVKRWLQSGKNTCPMCNTFASPSDIRVIFLDCYRMGSSYDLAEVRKELQQARKSNNDKSASIKDLQTQLAAVRGENRILRDRVSSLELQMKQKPSMTAIYGKANSFPKLSFFTKLNGKCKFMSYSKTFDLLAVSMKSTTGLFEGFGIELCSLYDTNTRSSKILHRNEIKDLSFHPSRSWLLTAGMDSVAKISGVDNLTLANMHALTMSTKVWSCCWSAKHETNFFLGLANGQINEYDIRNLASPVNQLKGAGNRLPVVSLKSFQHILPSEAVTGIVSSQLKSTVRLHQFATDRYNAQDVPLSGNCFSLSYMETTSSMLASSRCAGNKVVNEYFSLKFRDDSCYISLISKFESGGAASLLNKPLLCSGPSNEVWACTMDDKERTLQVFDAPSGSLRHTTEPNGELFNQVERITVPGKQQYALLGLSPSGLHCFVN